MHKMFENIRYIFCSGMKKNNCHGYHYRTQSEVLMVKLLAQWNDSYLGMVLT